MATHQLLEGQIKDLGGGFKVRRLLPAATRQAVGPFLFMDHFGPVTVEPGAANDVRPHPHVGLATVSYLFDGAMMHRDSLGNVQRIEPGAVNWMTSGRGIVHSERCPDDLRETKHVTHGIQLWAALPKDQEACAPEFVHAPANQIPQIQVGNVTVRVLLGEAFGGTSPIKTFTQTIYLDVCIQPGDVLNLPALAPELAVYSLDQVIYVDGAEVAPQTLAILPEGGSCQIRSVNGARVMVIGGATMDGPRFMWWNFVSSRKETIAMAAQDWSGHVFGYVVDETEMAPLPDRRTAIDRRTPTRPTDRRTKVAKRDLPASGK